MANKTPHLLFKKTWVDFLKEEFANDPKQTMEIFFAICDYAYEGTIPDDSMLRLAIGTIRKEIDMDRQAYEELSDKRRQVRLSAVEKRKNAQTNVDFVDENITNATNVTNLTNGTNIIYNNISNSNELQDKKKKNNAKKEKPECSAFDLWLKEQYPRISKMEKALTEDEYNTLKLKFGEQSVLEKMARLENYKDAIKKYVSSYLTLNNWLRNGNDNTNREGNEPKQDAATAVLGSIFDISR